MDKRNQYKTTFLINQGRSFFRKTVMANKLSSDSWMRASDKVIYGLEGVNKLVGDLPIAGKDYTQMVEKMEELLERCREAGMTLVGNHVQVRKKVSFAGYVIDGYTQYADQMKIEVITNYPWPTTLKELVAWPHPPAKEGGQRWWRTKC